MERMAQECPTLKNETDRVAGNWVRYIDSRRKTMSNSVNVRSLLPVYARLLDKENIRKRFSWFVACSHSCATQNRNVSCNQEWQCPARGSILICILYLRYWYWFGGGSSDSIFKFWISWPFQVEVREKERDDQGESVFLELFALWPVWQCQWRRFRCHWVRHSTAGDTLAGVRAGTWTFIPLT